MTVLKYSVVRSVRYSCEGLMMNGTVCREHLVSWFNLRSRAFWFGLCVGIGGISPDLDHLASLLFKTQWSFLHQPIFTGVFVGLVVASGIGLLAAVYLKKL